MSMRWYGELPERWKVQRIKLNYREVNTLSEDGSEEMLSVSHVTGVTPRSQKNVNMFLAKTNIGQKKCQPGDIVVNTMWAWMAAMGVTKYSGIVSPSYGVYRPIKNDKYNPTYLDYLLRIENYRVEYARRSTGVTPSRMRLYPNKFLDIKFICPPREEQDQIVRYLDWKVSQINRLINAKHRQVLLLQEKIDLLTNSAIVKPKKQVRLKHIVSVPRGWIQRELSVLYSPVGVLNRGRGIFHKTQLPGEDLGDSDFFVVEPNTMMISGQFGWEGAVALTTEKEIGCIASHRYYTIRGKENICNTAFLWAFFRTKFGDMILNECSHGAAGRNKPLNFTEFLNKFIPLPSIEVQNEIAQHVHIQMKYREAIKGIEFLLTEYRTRLISDIVSGKTDVCGVTVPEYEVANDASEVDVIDDTVETDE